MTFYRELLNNVRHACRYHIIDVLINVLSRVHEYLIKSTLYKSTNHQCHWEFRCIILLL